MEIWEPKTPGTLWATPGLLRDSFTILPDNRLYCRIQKNVPLYNPIFRRIRDLF